MTKRNINRLIRGLLALVALALAAYQYSSEGLSGTTALFLFLTGFLGFQAATGAG
jgi:heme A synthase